jgi:hypothetical protein
MLVFLVHERDVLLKCRLKVRDIARSDRQELTGSLRGMKLTA